MKWGFIGYGRIARKFEESLKHTDHELVAIASRSGYENVVPPIKAYRTYGELYADPEIDIIYVSTTHNDHCKQTIASLKSGKHVLCEKPLATSAGEVQQMIDAARENNRFLMEAIWTRYLPGYQKVMELIRAGAIGEIKFIHADFGFHMNPDAPKERLIRPELAAGAVWDVGIYPLVLAQDIFKDDPLKIQVTANLTPLKIEDRCAMQLTYPGGRMAQLSCAIDLQTTNHALISGSKGNIIMYDFWKCEKFSLRTKGENKDFEFPMTSNGLYHEAVACAGYIENGLIESPLVSFNHSLQIARLMDQVIFLARSGK